MSLTALGTAWVASTRPLRSRVRHVWDRFSVYMPMILMALFALLSYWMVRNAPSVLSQESEAPVKHEADYFMEDFSVRVYDVNGKLKSEIQGVQGKHFPDTDTVEIVQPRVKVYSQQGQLTTARADKGIMNGDGTEVQLIDNAVIFREPLKAQEPSQQMNSDFFHLFTDTEVIKTYMPVELLRGDKDRFTAERMDYDNLSQTMILTGRVRGVMTPKNKK
jgi:lipopolysaccharide export system protein LptC